MIELIITNILNDEINIKLPDCDFAFDKNISFINHDVHNLIFTEAFQLLSSIDYTVFTKLIIKINNKEYYTQDNIQDCVCRIIGYSYGGEKYEIREVLTFKFIVSNKYIIQDELIYCDNKCPFYDNKIGYCKRYRENLLLINNKHFITKMCYLQIEVPLLRNLKITQYYDLIKQIKN